MAMSRLVVLVCHDIKLEISLKALSNKSGTAMNSGSLGKISSRFVMAVLS